MALDAGAWIRLGSGVVWLALGVAVLALARDRPGRALGVLAAGFGVQFVYANSLSLVDPGWHPALTVLNFAVADVACGVAALLLSWHAAAERAARVWTLGIGALAVVGAVTCTVLLLGGTATPDASGISAAGAGVYRRLVGSFAFMMIALAGLTGALASAYRRRPSRGTALAAVGIGLYVGYWAADGVAVIGGGDPFTETFGPAIVATLVVVVGASGWWLWAARGAGARAARNVAWLLLASATLGALASALAWDWGEIGIVRTLGAAFVAVAVFRHGFLDLPLPRIVARKGAVATGALAALFIVAQVAQNFLSAEYGLLMGGVVAGAFLFAAQPLQRAMERTTGGRRGASQSGDPLTATTRLAESERAYKVALRRFLADGGLTPEEELALAHLADEAGLSIKRAIEIRHEIEQETRGGRVA